MKKCIRDTRVFEVFLCFAVFGLGVGCSGPSKPTDDLRFGGEEIIGTIGPTNIIAETWYTKGVIGLPIWRVCQKQGVTNSEVLFIVEKELQESIPNYPEFISTNGAHLIQDRTRSYIFSLKDRRFVTNQWTGLVYTGDYKSERK